MFLQKAQTFKTIQFKRIPEDNIIQGILVIITKLRTLMGENMQVVCKAQPKTMDQFSLIVQKF